MPLVKIYDIFESSDLKKILQYQGVTIVYQMERAWDQWTSSSFVLTLLSHNFE